MSPCVKVYPSYVLSAVNRLLLGLNQLVPPAAPASECPDVLYAAFPSRARRHSTSCIILLSNKTCSHRPLFQLLGM